MLDSNANKSKGNLPLEKWIEKDRPDLKKTYIPEGLTGFEQFTEFVDERWELLKDELKKAMSFE